MHMHAYIQRLMLMLDQILYALHLGDHRITKKQNVMDITLIDH